MSIPSVPVPKWALRPLGNSNVLPDGMSLANVAYACLLEKPFQTLTALLVLKLQ